MAFHSLPATEHFFYSTLENPPATGLTPGGPPPFDKGGFWHIENVQISSKGPLVKGGWHRRQAVTGGFFITARLQRPEWRCWPGRSPASAGPRPA